jgi:hypothetical protein
VTSRGCRLAAVAAAGRWAALVHAEARRCRSQKAATRPVAMEATLLRCRRRNRAPGLAWVGPGVTRLAPAFGSPNW